MALFVICGSMLLSSCSRKISFLPSATVPAATGKIKVGTTDNQNYSISISILHLADAQRLHPPKNTYVAWIRTSDDHVRNIGQFRSHAATFSSTLKASLKTVTPFKPVKIFVTAEDDGAVTYPHGEPVLSTDWLENGKGGL